MNMLDETKDWKFSLQPSKKRISSLVHKVNVPNFFILPEYDNTNYEVKSPLFKYANATWQFEIQGYKNFTVSSHAFHIYLSRLNYTYPKQLIICTIDLLDADGERYDRGCKAFILDKNEYESEDESRNEYESEDEGRNEYDGEDEDGYICSFDNFKPSYDKSGTLTLFIHLISDESFEKLPTAIKRGVDTLSKDLKELFVSGKNHDLILKVAEKEFRVHRGILMARSRVFDAMLSHDTKEKEKGVVDVLDCDPQALEQLLFYMYSGKVETLNPENVLGVYYAADKYQMISLKEECSKYIKKCLSVSEICSVVQLALNHNDADLLECATEFFVNNTSKIFRTVEWMSFMKSNTIAANDLLIKSTMLCNCKKS